MLKRVLMRKLYMQ